MESDAAAALASPPHHATPPPATGGKRSHTNGAGPEAVNADALNKALQGIDELPRPRQRTPASSPSRKRPRHGDMKYGDR